MAKNVTATALDFAALAKEIGQSIGEVNAIENKAAALKETANKNIAALHSAKIKVGTYRKDKTGCAIATAFIDGCVTSGIKESTAQKVYLPTFKAAVSSGKPVADWNSQRKAKASKAKASGTGKTLAQKLATAFRDEGFADFLEGIQSAYENAEIESLIEGIESYLTLEGALKEAPDATI